MLKSDVIKTAYSETVQLLLDEDINLIDSVYVDVMTTRAQNFKFLKQEYLAYICECASKLDW